MFWDFRAIDSGVRDGPLENSKRVIHGVIQFRQSFLMQNKQYGEPRMNCRKSLLQLNLNSPILAVT
jgi:hypothetical protein